MEGASQKRFLWVVYALSLISYPNGLSAYSFYLHKINKLEKIAQLKLKQASTAWVASCKRCGAK